MARKKGLKASLTCAPAPGFDSRQLHGVWSHLVWVWITDEMQSFLSWSKSVSDQISKLNSKVEALVSRFDEALAANTAYITDLKNQRADLRTQLAEALTVAQTLRDTDAAEDAAQANALSEDLAAKLEAATAAAKAEPAEPAPIPAPEPDEVAPAEPNPTDFSQTPPIVPVPAPEPEPEPAVDVPASE